MLRSEQNNYFHNQSMKLSVFLAKYLFHIKMQSVFEDHSWITVPFSLTYDGEHFSSCSIFFYDNEIVFSQVC